MRLRRWLSLIGLLLLSSSSYAANCNIEAGVLPFYAYNTLQDISQTVISSLTLTCTSPTDLEVSKGVIVQVGLDAGQGSVSDRILSNGTDHLHYNVYLDPSFQTILGLGSGSGSVINACLDSPQCGSSATNTSGQSLILHLYGAMPPHQDVAPGSYSDNLLLQVSF